MSKVKVLMLRAPGTNRDVDTQIAFEMAGAEVDSALVNELYAKGKTPFRLSNHGHSRRLYLRRRYFRR